MFKVNIFGSMALSFFYNLSTKLVGFQLNALPIHPCHQRLFDLLYLTSSIIHRGSSINHVAQILRLFDPPLPHVVYLSFSPKPLPPVKLRSFFIYFFFFNTK